MKYMLLCNNCPNKVFTNGTDIDKFSIIPTAKLPKRGDGKSTEAIEQKKKIRCPECGYLFKIVKLGPEQVVEDKKDHPEFEREVPKDPSWLNEDDKKKKK